jgi:predicted nucleotide-binding protein (sugar kinase/HSP70/actin superfamily)
MEQTYNEPYRTYKPRPFTREERDDTTILFGGLHWRAERLIQGALGNLGYKTQVLPTASKEDLLTGREVADIGQCCPTSFTTGNVANFLKSESERIGAEEVARKYVYFTAGSCGSCRFGQYHQSYELALRNIGMESFRMFLMAQDGLDQGSVPGGGLDLNLNFTMGTVWSILVADVLQDLEYQTRPYEVNPGETERVTKESVEYLYEIFRNSPVQGKHWTTLPWYLVTDYFVNALRKVKKNYQKIEVDRLRIKPVVKITGEFYLQTVEGDPNYNIHRWLESEGAEVYPAVITIWLDYLLRLASQKFEDHQSIESTALLKKFVVNSMQWTLRLSYNRMRKALGNIPRELPQQSVLRELAAPYYHSRLTGGEGDMLIGKALYAYHNKKAHMTCELSPYSCMPNTMSIGAMAAVTGKYPDLLYAPLEIKGDAEVHALSRCQMILTEAKKKAQREYEEALQFANLTPDDVKNLQEDFPETKQATFKIPHFGAAGTAANVVLYLNSKKNS